MMLASLSKIKALVKVAKRMATTVGTYDRSWYIFREAEMDRF